MCDEQLMRQSKLKDKAAGIDGRDRGARGLHAVRREAHAFPDTKMRGEIPKSTIASELVAPGNAFSSTDATNWVQLPPTTHLMCHQS